MRWVLDALTTARGTNGSSGMLTFNALDDWYARSHTDYVPDDARHVHHHQHYHKHHHHHQHHHDFGPYSAIRNSTRSAGFVPSALTRTPTTRYGN